ncbi:MAG TPA: DEDD exonuclease domain-containing protein [Mycobacteriales bacterium]|jgi:DNA polymerase-3 subunit epsilon|nr:DEDD exonuclease domain-containing protein [Mycobacteriales bacterium]
MLASAPRPPAPPPYPRRPERGGRLPVPAQPLAVQGTFDELGTPLRETTFVVVDLETTGGSPHSCHITEIGAVKVRGGEVLGEFQTLVNPAAAIPPFIAVLTGITDAMVAGAPDLAAALPSFLEFSRGAVLVAHNAPFDLGFLKAGCERLDLAWPAPDSVDTARLARRVMTRDEAPNCKLSTLARLFRADTEPCHRALADARATVDVLHGLLARLGGLGVHSLEELRTFSAQVTPAQRRKRHLADALPHLPGVYLFRDARGRVLYVGKSVDLRRRVRQYFTASEMRTRMAEMVACAERVDPVVCTTPLEADVRELRLIAEHRPKYNRRSRFPERAVWVKLTVEAFPRLSLVRKVQGDGATYLGPFGTARGAELAMAAAHEALPLRQCTKPVSARRPGSACVLYEMGRCGAPCLGEAAGGESALDYAAHAEAFRAAAARDPRPVVRALSARTAALAAAERFEDAAAQRDRLTAFVRAAARLQRLSALTDVQQLVAARPTDDLGWELAVVRRGRLVAAGTIPYGAHPAPYVDALVATAETVLPVPGPLPAATAEEVECVLRWLERPGTRLVRLEGIWASPAAGAGGHGALLAAGEAGRAAATPFDDRRGLRPVERPARAAR